MSMTATAARGSRGGVAATPERLGPRGRLVVIGLTGASAPRRQSPVPARSAARPARTLAAAGSSSRRSRTRPLRIDPERVIAVSRKHVQMNMRNLLEGGFTIGKEQIHTFIGCRSVVTLG